MATKPEMERLLEAAMEMATAWLAGEAVLKIGKLEIKMERTKTNAAK